MAEVYTIAELRRREREYNSTKHFFYDVIIKIHNGLKGDDMFKTSDKYECHTFTDKDSAYRFAQRYADKYADNENAYVGIKEWSVLNDKFNEESWTTIKESKYEH